MNNDKRHKELEEIIDKFEDLWTKNPDLRFFQLLEIIGNNTNMFYTTDKDALGLINKTDLWLSVQK